MTNIIYAKDSTITCDPLYIPEGTQYHLGQISSTLSCLWKSSVLPFLYHGLEDTLLEKDGVESANQMEHAAGKVKAYSGSSDMEVDRFFGGLLIGLVLFYAGLYAVIPLVN